LVLGQLSSWERNLLSSTAKPSAAVARTPTTSINSLTKANPAALKGITGISSGGGGSVGASVVQAAASSGGVQRQAFKYPSSLPAVPPDVLAAFGAQRRLGTAGVEQAELFRTRGMTEGDARRLSATNEVTRQGGRDVNTTMANYASVGRARSPLGLNQNRAEIAGGMERQQVMLEEELAKLKTELDRMVSDAQFNKQRIDADIDMQMAQYRSNSALENLRQRQQVDMMNWQMGLT
jgi:hypothetical protein